MIPFVSPKKAAVPPLPMETAVFTVAEALNVHHKHPVGQPGAHAMCDQVPRLLDVDGLGQHAVNIEPVGHHPPAEAA